MRTFYESRYRFYNQLGKIPFNILILSDIHFSHIVKNKQLNSIVKYAREQKPEYILIPGDIVDSLTEIDGAHELARLCNFFEKLGKIAPTFAILGNHDFYIVPEGYKCNIKSPWAIRQPDILRSELNKIPGVTLLDNQSYEDERIHIFGFTQTPEYFWMNLIEEGASERGILPEDKNTLIEDIKKIDSKHLSKLPQNRLKIALMHSPIRVSDPDVSKYFDEFDFIICGHTHNGATPPVLQDFWRSDRGLTAPGRREKFPHNVRIGLYPPEKRLIICGAINSISVHAKPFAFLNHFFPVFTTRLEISDNPIYKRKPDQKHKYISF